MDNAYRRDCPSLYRGVVESNIDPENLGRCKIRVPSIHGTLTYPVDILPWARPLVLSPVGKDKGAVNIPDTGDIVWVLFEGSNRNFPVYFGGTYAKDELEISTHIIEFYIEEDTRISYDRENKVYSIKVGDNLFKMSPEHIEVLGNIKITGDLEVSGNTTLNNTHVNGSFSQEE